ncbi:hypothetical protein KFK09_014226 [Dendrobium nobile]|uniref:Uncharacterized protein n=1 Tax=Dendrobium nobile TaxID=94219 RepID=A0A8T3BBZ3_DENNO|nr:hypothetical protein KFK09_014226 [Dendrobium nobile]
MRKKTIQSISQRCGVEASALHCCNTVSIPAEAFCSLSFSVEANGFAALSMRVRGQKMENLQAFGIHLHMKGGLVGGQQTWLLMVITNISNQVSIIEFTLFLVRATFLDAKLSNDFWDIYLCDAGLVALQCWEKYNTMAQDLWHCGGPQFKIFAYFLHKNSIKENFITIDISWTVLISLITSLASCLLSAHLAQ